jgi:signal transduction histidine kinase
MDKPTKEERGELEKVLGELRDARDQLVAREKMASLGDLVAGVAHEINNPVAAVKSATDVSSRCLDRLTELIEKADSVESIVSNRHYQTAMQLLRENVEIALEGSKRIANIVKGLKTFARVDESELTLSDIHEGLDSTLTLLHHRTRNRIAVNREYGSVAPFYCYPQELNQVFMNILANAIDAIAGEGTISIHTSADDKHVHIRISDDGQGILKECVEKILEPGYTTKGVGVGTGLGLPISLNIIEKHKGTLDVSSRAGEGTTFTIRLPRNLEEDAQG